MKRIFTVIGLVLLFFLVEYLFSIVFGPYLLPNFMLLLIIFVDMSMGIRYALLAAFVGGAIKDAYSIEFFGFHILTYMLCAYLTTLVARGLHQKGSWLSLILMIFCIHSVLLICQGALSFNLGLWPEFIKQIYAPEIISTLLVSGVIFNYLRKCVLKLYES